MEEAAIAHGRDKSRAHLEVPVRSETIRSPGIDEAVVAPSHLAGALLERFDFLAAEGIGRYKPEDVAAVVSLAYWELRLEDSIGEDDEAAVKEASHQVLKHREKLGALPPQRFSQASRQRGAEHYKAEDGARSVYEAVADAHRAVGQ